MVFVTATPTPEHELSTGARPEGTATELSAAKEVQQMFDHIAPTYDISNHILSMGLDRWMWSRAARTFRTILQRPETVTLDLCCGTGDMTLALYVHRPKPGAPSQAASPSEVESIPAIPPPSPILALDFSHEMLTRGAEKFAAHNIIAIEADALHLPLASNSVDLVTSAFGFRNLANYEEGLAEIRRVLRPGGQFGILECNQPEGLIGAIYNLYFKRILPSVGGLISGDFNAYSYLPASVERFPRPARMLQLIRNTGYQSVTWTSYALGTAGLYRATKP